MSNFIVTEQAYKRIAQISGGAFLRVAVDGGGCSGFQYIYKFDTEKNEGDTTFNSETSSVVVDSVSMGFLEGSMLDYVEDLGSAGFEIKNPNATARCGCGNSFSVNL